jgi:hypothetical protein
MVNTGFDSRQGQEIFLSSEPSRPALVPTQPPIQWVPGVPSLGIKQLGLETEHSLPSGVEVNNERNCLHGAHRNISILKQTSKLLVLLCNA